MPRRSRKKSYKVTKENKDPNAPQKQKLDEHDENERKDDSNLNISDVGGDVSENSHIETKDDNETSVESQFDGTDGNIQCETSIQEQGSEYEPNESENTEISQANDFKQMTTDITKPTVEVVEPYLEPVDSSDGDNLCESARDGFEGNIAENNGNRRRAIPIDRIERNVMYDARNVHQLLLVHANEPYVIGIDVGTMYTKAVISHPPTFSMFHVLDETGDSIIPTVVGFTDTIGDDLVGKEAVEYLKNHRKSVIFDIKRIIGRERNDPLVEGRKYTWPFKISGELFTAEVVVKRMQWQSVCLLPEEVMQPFLARILTHARNMKQNQNPRCTVLTVPNFFNNRQRLTLMQAARAAGFQNVHLINELTAEALHCRMTGIIHDGQKAVFFHFGAGSMDCTVVTVEQMHITIVSSYSNMYSGGQDFTNDLIMHIKRKFGHFIGLFTRKVINKLRLICEDMKKQFSSSNSPYSFNCSEFYLPTNVEVEVSRNEFENLCLDRFKNVESLVQNTLETAELTHGNIHKVVLTGDGCEIPLVRALFGRMFPDSRIIRITDPHVAAKGAALYANGIYSRNETVRITDIKPYQVYTSHEMTLEEIIPFNTQIPASHPRTIDMRGKERMAFDVKELYPTIGHGDYSLGFFNLNNVDGNGTAVPITYKVDRNGVFGIEQGLDIDDVNDERLSVHYFN